MLEILALVAGAVVCWGMLAAVAGRQSILTGNPFVPFLYKTLATTVPGLVLTMVLKPTVGYSRLLSADAVQSTALWVAYSLVAFPVGAALSVPIWRRPLRSSFRGFLGHRPCHNLGVAAMARTRRRLTAMSALLLLIMTATTLYVYVHLPSIPLLMLASSPEQIALARGAATWGFEGNRYLLTILGQTFVPMANCVLLAVMLSHRTRMLKVTFCLSCAATFLMLFYNGAKAPPLNQMWALYMGYIYAGASETISWKRAAQLGLVTLAAMLIMFRFMMGVDFATNLNIFRTGSMAARVVFSQMHSLVAHFQVFPEVVPFQRGASMASFLAGERVEIPARLVMEWMNPAGVQRGQAGYAAAYYIGAAWADFGHLGVLLVPVAVGFLWTSIFTLLTRRWSPVRAGLLAYLAGWFGSQAQASATRLLYFPELIVSAAIILACQAIGEVVVVARRQEAPE